MNGNETLRNMIVELFQIFDELEKNSSKNNIDKLLLKKYSLNLLINQTIEHIEKKYYKSKEDLKTLELMKKLKG